MGPTWVLSGPDGPHVGPKKLAIRDPIQIHTWWRHQMETFSALLVICARNSPVPGEFPTQRPVTRSFDVFFDLRLNKRLSKQWWGWWFGTPSWSLWRHRNDLYGSAAISSRVVNIIPLGRRVTDANPVLADGWHTVGGERCIWDSEMIDSKTRSNSWMSSPTSVF